MAIIERPLFVSAKEQGPVAFFAFGHDRRAAGLIVAASAYE